MSKLPMGEALNEGFVGLSDAYRKEKSEERKVLLNDRLLAASWTSRAPGCYDIWTPAPTRAPSKTNQQPESIEPRANAMPYPTDRAGTKDSPGKMTQQGFLRWFEQTCKARPDIVNCLITISSRHEALSPQDAFPFQATTSLPSRCSDGSCRRRSRLAFARPQRLNPTVWVTPTSRRVASCPIGLSLRIYSYQRVWGSCLDLLPAREAQGSRHAEPSRGYLARICRLVRLLAGRRAGPGRIQGYCWDADCRLGSRWSDVRLRG